MKRSSVPRKSNLLLCFDAFGTLFRPKEPIEKQYLRAAQKHGWQSGFESDHMAAQELSKAFRLGNWNITRLTASTIKVHELTIHSIQAGGERTSQFRQKSRHECRAVVISNSFKPLIKPDQILPAHVVPDLLRRFSSREAYELFDSVGPFFSMLRDTKAHLITNSRQPAPPPSSTDPSLSAQWPWQHTTVGIITNSDDRVPDILSSFDLRVGRRRVGKRAGVLAKADPREDISFVVLSYDTGFEKPSHHIFDAAMWMLEECLAAEAKDGRMMDSGSFEKLMIGDSLVHDYRGARNAGWDALLFDSSGQYSDALQEHDIAAVDVDGETVMVIDDLRSLVSWPPDQDRVQE